MIESGSANFEIERQKRETIPVRLFKIGGNPTLYFTDLDVPVNHDGEVWQPKGVSYSRIKHQLGMEVDTCTIAIDNVADDMIAWANSVDPTGYWTTIYKGFTDGALSDGKVEIYAGKAIVLFHGRNTSIKVDEEFELTVKAHTDFYRQIGPKSTQDVTCRFRGINGFKGTNCGYSGPETVCNYTEARCRQLGNIARFGGFPSLNAKVDS